MCICRYVNIYMRKSAHTGSAHAHAHAHAYICKMYAQYIDNFVQTHTFTKIHVCINTHNHDAINRYKDYTSIQNRIRIHDTYAHTCTVHAYTHTCIHTYIHTYRCTCIYLVTHMSSDNMFASVVKLSVEHSLGCVSERMADRTS